MYDELRQLVRGTRFGRTGTLSGTALTNEALARLFLSARPDDAARQALWDQVRENRKELWNILFYRRHKTPLNEWPLTKAGHSPSSAFRRRH